jgi:hypothetical protein
MNEVFYLQRQEKSVIFPGKMSFSYCFYIPSHNIVLYKVRGGDLFKNDVYGTSEDPRILGELSAWTNKKVSTNPAVLMAGPVIFRYGKNKLEELIQQAKQKDPEKIKEVFELLWDEIK